MMFASDGPVAELPRPTQLLEHSVAPDLVEYSDWGASSVSILRAAADQSPTSFRTDNYSNPDRETPRPNEE